MTYSEKLRDPRWQKKRLEILKRDKFKCTYCGDKETELQIHHLKYSSEPWNSENINLVTLCKHCHKTLTFIQPFNILRIKKIKYIGSVFIYCEVNCGDYKSIEVVMIDDLDNLTEQIKFAKSGDVFKELLKFVKNG